jgi:uncharacterized cupin superfamily protein
MPVCLEIGMRVADDCSVYSDIDMIFDPRLGGYAHRNGTPHAAK